MPDFLRHRNNIILSDYDYMRDIENRMFMSNLSVEEVEVLKEILDGSLKVSVKQLASYTNTSEKKLISIIDKFSEIKLVKRVGDAIHVDKEMRKYYESQIQKFDDNFEPNMEFLQGLLSKVPIQVLPSWYSISFSSENIIGSILENYLNSPKVYETYLSQLKFEIPVLNDIVQEVFASSELKVKTADLIKKYRLKRELFEEYMLYLEYNFVCCLGYNCVDGMWEEVITPFYEWRSYLQFLEESAAQPIKQKNIQPDHPEEVGYVHDLTILLTALLDDFLKVQKLKKGYSLPKDKIVAFLPHLEERTDKQSYIAELIDLLLDLDLVEIESNEMNLTKEGRSWVQSSANERSFSVYRYKLNQLRQSDLLSSFADKDIREVERSLKAIATKGWVYFDDFVKSLTAPIGSTNGVVLENKGKKWRYAIPTYSQSDLDFVRVIVFDILSSAGVVVTGTHNKKECLKVTSFGRVFLGL